MKDSLNHVQVEIQRKASVPDPITNQPIDGWEVFRSVKGSILYGNGKEAYEAPQFVGSQSAKVYVRFREDKQADSSMRVVVGNIVYSVEGVSVELKSPRLRYEVLNLTFHENYFRDGNAGNRD
jgi:SPP1 family predicted phage head-tail adaptor